MNIHSKIICLQEKMNINVSFQIELGCVIVSGWGAGVMRLGSSLDGSRWNAICRALFSV